MESGKYLQVLNYLNKYSGRQYKKLEKCETDEERSYMQSGSDEGKTARQSFSELVELLESSLTGFKAVRISQWQNSGNFVRYFWCQLKRLDAIDSNISISLFAEKIDGSTRFRVSVELAVDYAKPEERDAYKRILDIQLDDGLSYVSGGNNEPEFQVLDEKDNQIVKQKNYKKVQVSYLLDCSECSNDSNVENSLVKGALMLTKYYELAVGQKNENEDNTWWPSAEEYDPGFDKQKWLEVLNNPEVIGPVWGGILAMFYDYGGEATCTQLGQRYRKNPASIRSSATQLAMKIHDVTDCPLFMSNDKKKYWTVLFQGRQAADNEDGSWIWKLRPELHAALKEFDILRFLPGEAEVPMNTKDILNSIKEYIAAKGFVYPAGVVENFFLCLKSKPFVILAGTSGTGKTRLVKLFAEAIGAKYVPIPVRPDWSDGSDLFGHYDLNGNFIDGPVCEAFDAAAENPSQPIMLCIDEMNLARVEYYLSDFLSVIESRDRHEDGKIITDPIAQYKGGIPDNLYIVGTVNMDETTFPFSKKVLDRANTIEFNYVDLIPEFDSFDEEVTPQKLPNSFLCTEYLVLAQDCADEKEYIVQICDELQKINEILKSANAHVGYRVRDEIAFYMLNNKNADYLLTDDQAMDNEIMQKILPRIQGSSAAIKEMLVKLFKYCMGDSSGLDIDSGKAGVQMQAMSHAARYPKSADKLGYMMTRFEEDGFTSYWL